MKGYKKKNKGKKQVKVNEGNQIIQSRMAPKICDLRPWCVQGRFAPDSLIAICNYNDTNNGQFTNAAAVYTSRRWRLNSGYDPDPNLGSGSMAGFGEWAALYNLYKVIRVDYDVSVVNKETAAPIQVILAPTTSDVGTNYSSIDELVELPFAKNAICSVSGGQDRVRYRGSLSLEQLLGDAVKWRSDPQFGAATNTNPSTMFYLNIGAFMLGGTFTGLGLGMTARLKYHIMFYDRKNVIS